jgi:hypothetical protein
MKNKLALSALLALAFLLAACVPEAMPAIEATTDPYAASSADTISTIASVEVSDQTIEHSAVTVAKVNAAVDGWLVIHIEADGKPDPVIGYAQVPTGGSKDVKVTIDSAMATTKMFAMLHVDEGVKGTYEFPGADAPVKDGNMIVMQAFNQTEVMIMSTPAVTANEQSVVDGTVTVASAYMEVPGWLVIHIEADGKPGPVIGYVALPAGESKDIKIAIDASQATPKLFAMLHIDAGIASTYEFPGDDAPVKDGDMIVMVPFNLK